MPPPLPRHAHGFPAAAERAHVDGQQRLVDGGRLHARQRRRRRRERLGRPREGPVEAVEGPAGVGQEGRLRERLVGVGDGVRSGQEEADVDEAVGRAGEDEGGSVFAGGFAVLWARLASWGRYIVEKMGWCG